MDRRAWLEQRRIATRAAYDEEAATYDDDPYPAGMQASFVARVLDSCPPDGLVLDAPCGTGRYFAQVVAAGRRVVGVDQSAGMLEQARAKGIATALHRLGLQELEFDATFDATLTIDGMENVSPEEWPLVLANLHRAVRPGGHLYLTVEEVGEGRLDRAFKELSARGVPAVRGEVVEGDTAGYHYYPGRDLVTGWLREAGLEVVAQDIERHRGYRYWHLLVRRP